MDKIQGSNKRAKALGITMGVLLVAIGITFIVLRKDLVNILPVIAGIFLMTFGAFKIIYAFINKDEGNNKPLSLAIGAISVGLGVYLLINTSATITLVGISMGVFAVASAFDRFNVALARKKTGNKWQSTAIFGLIHIAFGVLMFVAAYSMLSLIVIFSGIYLLISGLMIILSIVYFLDYK
ncbi:MAG: DUF308 domain-containing protein [Anaerovoracaceae bacterium]